MYLSFNQAGHRIYLYLTGSKRQTTIEMSHHSIEFAQYCYLKHWSLQGAFCLKSTYSICINKYVIIPIKRKLWWMLFVGCNNNVLVTFFNLYLNILCNHSIKWHPFPLLQIPIRIISSLTYQHWFVNIRENIRKKQFFSYIHR